MLNGAAIEFELVQDVPDGGVLFALPALLLYGLLDKSREIFSMPEGFYPLESIFLLLALMAVTRHIVSWDWRQKYFVEMWVFGHAVLWAADRLAPEVLADGIKEPNRCDVGAGERF